MSKQREALKLALDTLRGWIGIDEWIWPVTAKETCKKNSLEAITAIREALAEPEHHYEDDLDMVVRKPLNDTELWTMWVESPSDVLRFARAIERAHGITE